MGGLAGGQVVCVLAGLLAGSGGGCWLSALSNSDSFHCPLGSLHSPLHRLQTGHIEGDQREVGIEWVESEPDRLSSEVK